ncbi:hypothetical protein LTR56_009429 [Elasticomyces elasticus]|nr:hypothetical protein LTR56_009429 [Elasticomyces elasticus]KAK3645862.1 hypothetical protein LTR22_014528 [Elasticomyces elasticus]KAK4931050.1 hypothetical protein LTR49_002465 [Elasticomyces elasticus]KAK5765517.1 hypothetical protein LTS12_004268 [Elasticomyces elasticus]
MHIALLTAALAGITAVAALQNPHSKVPKKAKRVPAVQHETKHAHHKRQSSYLTSKTAKFAVNGSAIPEVDFDIGESYAGTLSIDSNSTSADALWFWFFPSENPAACEEIVIWLNGGPGCSSLDGLLQENGPFLWQSGTYSPIKNPYSWVNLTNMIWVDVSKLLGVTLGCAPSRDREETQAVAIGLSLLSRKAYDRDVSQLG